MAAAKGSARKPASPAALLAPLRAGFERYFRSTIDANANPGGRLGEAIRYAALSPGKRLRPLLALSACEAAGGTWRDALPAAAAIECVHAFSLVHDDLPAMDDDDFRRGRLTTHKKFGEALGVLAGDALLAFAFEELLRLPIARRDPRRGIAATRLLAMASGAHALVGGQAEDIAAEGRKVSRDTVESIHTKKTGALMGAAAGLGALAGGANAAGVEAMADAGMELGIAFQIQDDLLNDGSSLRRLGKRAGTDRARGKATWPRAVGVERSIEDATAHFTSAFEGVQKLGPKAKRLSALVIEVAERDR
jgi:geranylgeranyl diphosphate synthase type II